MHPTQIWYTICYFLSVYFTNRFKIRPHGRMCVCVCDCACVFVWNGQRKDRQIHTIYICWFVILIRTHIIFSRRSLGAFRICHLMQLHVSFASNVVVLFVSQSLIVIQSIVIVCTAATAVVTVIVVIDEFLCVRRSPHDGGTVSASQPQCHCAKKDYSLQFLIKTTPNTNAGFGVSEFGVMRCCCSLLLLKVTSVNFYIERERERKLSLMFHKSFGFSFVYQASMWFHFRWIFMLFAHKSNQMPSFNQIRTSFDKIQTSMRASER